MRKMYCTVLLFLLSLCSLSFGYSGGDGTALKPYQISDSNDLLKLADTPTDYNHHFVLMSDIDLQGQVFTSAIIAKDVNDLDPEYQGTAFTGVFDGGGHRITNFFIHGSSNDYLGLFGYIQNGVVRNLGIEDCQITFTTNSDFIGGLAGFSEESSFYKCHVTANISGGSESTFIGGLIGSSYRGTVEYCSTSGNVEGMQDTQFLGGLVGSNLNSDIRFCYATGDIAGHYDVGGLCGSSNGTISFCYTTGTVSGPENSSYLGNLCGSNFAMISSCYASGQVDVGAGSVSMGGLCGFNSGTINDSYATGHVNCGDSSVNIGGLCGENLFGIIANCYSTGTVFDGGVSENIGALCGYQMENDSSISNSFWDQEASNMSVGYNRDPGFPGTVTNVLGLSTAQMQTKDSFTSFGWDFADETLNGTEDLWRMCEDLVGYPRLTWQTIPGDFGCPAGVGTEDLSVIIGCWLSVIRAAGDIDNNGWVNLEDYLILARHWQENNCGQCEGADLSGDGHVNEFDLMQMVEHWLMHENADCKIADLTADDEIDLKDVAIFARHWLETDSGSGVE